MINTRYIIIWFYENFLNMLFINIFLISKKKKKNHEIPVECSICLLSEKSFQQYTKHNFYITLNLKARNLKKIWSNQSLFIHQPLAQMPINGLLVSSNISWLLWSLCCHCTLPSSIIKCSEQNWNNLLENMFLLETLLL